MMRAGRRRHTALCAPVLLVLLGLGAPGLLLAQGTERVTTLAVVVREGETSEIRRPLTLRLVADSMVSAVPDSPVTLVLSAYTGPADPETLRAIAANAGADVLLLATVAGTDAEIAVDLQALDSLSGSVLRTATFADRLDSAYRILFGRFWNDLPNFLAELPAISSTAVLRVALEGEGLVVVEGVGRRRASPAEPAEFQLSAPASYRVTVNRDGYYPESISLLLEPGTAVDLAPESVQLPSVILDLGLHSLGFPRATLSWIPRGSEFALGIGLLSYAGGLNPFFTSGLDLPFTAVPLLEILATLAVPPLGPGVLAAGAGAEGAALAVQPALEFGLRLNVGGGPFVDAVIPAVLRLPLDLELQVRRGRAFWLRIAPALFFLADPDAAAVLLSSAQTVGPQPIAVGPVGLQIADPSFGFRMAF